MENTTPDPQSATRPARRPSRRLLVGAGAVVAAAVVVGGTQLVPTATPAEAAGSAATQALDDATQERLDALVAADEGYYPGALASVRDAEGRVADFTAGVGDIDTDAEIPEDGEVRIGSNTKTVTAVVVLQLVEEGLVGLDEPVETYLPGLLRGEGIDGQAITVRQLLQHTSGLPNYTYFLAEGLLPYQNSYKQPRELLDHALEVPASFAPGASWEYSNTNYLVAGLLVEAVTDRPLVEEITDRVIEPLALERTYFPNVGEQELRGEHPQAYHNDDPAAPLTDVTVQDPSFGWAAGQMVSTPSEVNRFFTALLDGELLAPRQLEQMRTTVPTTTEGEGYGLGLISRTLSCGDLAWGHGGSITGYQTTGGATDDGRAVTIATTRLPSTPEQIAVLQPAVDAELCR